MNLILVSVGVFQEYILTNIRQLHKLNHTSIYVITESRFFDKFDRCDVKLVDVASLDDSYKFNSVTKMDNGFRDGFWKATSSRFFYICALMKRDSILDVIHIENDVLLYYNCDILQNKLDRTKIYLPFDSYSRNIASIMYIPSHLLLEQVLDRFVYSENDMYNFALIRKTIPETIDQFPICCPSESFTLEQQYVCANFDLFEMAFDAAAIGQYLGGVDPRNTSGDTRGFINETCTIKYNNFAYKWVTGNDSMRRPFIILKNGDSIPIFNLHIHCKCLEVFC